VAEETIEQVGKERTAANEKTHGLGGGHQSSSSSNDDDATAGENKSRGRQSSKKGRKKSEANKGKGSTDPHKSDEDKQEDDKRRATIVAGSHDLYRAMAALVAMLLEHTPDDEEARRYGAYRKKVIDALNVLVVRMKVVWDAHPVVVC
jgi:hypothetical protein